MRRVLAVALVLISLPRLAVASGHGPVFGAATPTLGKGGWQVDQAWFGRLGEGSQTEEQMLRTMISFGLTEHLQISGSVPVSLVSSYFVPRGRMVAMMSSVNELEGIVSWRFHHQALGAGTRFESTLSAGAAMSPRPVHADGMETAPSVHLSAATGYISRAHYMWVGSGYQHHGQRGLDQMGNVVFVSGVYGYRPPALRLDYPKPDLRFFVEAMAEHTETALHHGIEMLTSGGTAVFVGPTALLLYKADGLEGGCCSRSINAPTSRRGSASASASTSAISSG